MKYKIIKTENGNIQEHRQVIETFLGRKLTKEVVHHIDKDKENNKLSNLMLFPNQSEHLKFHIYFDKYGFNQRTRRLIRDRWISYKF